MKITRERLIQIIKEELTDQDLAVPGYQPPEEQQPERLPQPERADPDAPYVIRYDVNSKAAQLEGPNIQKSSLVEPSDIHDIPRHLVSLGKNKAIIQITAFELKNMLEDMIEAHSDSQRNLRR